MFSVVLADVSVCAAVFKVVDVVAVVAVSFTVAVVLVVWRPFVFAARAPLPRLNETHNDNDTRRKTKQTTAEKQ